MFGVHVCVSTICKTLKNMGCTSQAMHRLAIQRSDEKRAKFMADISLYDVVWLDLSGTMFLRVNIFGSFPLLCLHTAFRRAFLMLEGWFCDWLGKQVTNIFPGVDWDCSVRETVTFVALTPTTM